MITRRPEGTHYLRERECYQSNDELNITLRAGQNIFNGKKSASSGSIFRISLSHCKPVRLQYKNVYIHCCIYSTTLSKQSNSLQTAQVVGARIYIHSDLLQSKETSSSNPVYLHPGSIEQVAIRSFDGENFEMKCIWTIKLSLFIFITSTIVCCC